MRTSTVERVVSKVAAEKGYTVLKNKRLLLSRNPRLYYQPDFLLVGKKGRVVVEIEWTTDARKSMIGDMVRAGMLRVDTFIGIVRKKSSFSALDAWGDLLRRELFNRLRVIPILAKDRKQLESALKKII